MKLHLMIAQLLDIKNLFKVLWDLRSNQYRWLPQHLRKEITLFNLTNQWAVASTALGALAIKVA